MEVKMHRLALLVTLSLFACASHDVRHVSSERTDAITVIATTDFHGELVGQDNPTADGPLLKIGGAPIYATYLKILREHAQGPVLWVDAGDLFQGSLESNYFEGSPVVKMMNYLGLQAAALGNHEFDYGPVGEKTVPRSPEDDPRGALKARISEAHFPVLAANVLTTKGTIPSWLKASVVIPVGGLRVGVVGGASPGTPGTTNALNLVGLNFLPLLPSVQTEAERLRREEHVDLVVLTMHEGGSCGDNDVATQDNLASCDDTTVIDLANKLPAGLVNMIIAGHTHKGMAKRVNGIVVIQPYSHGKYIGWAKLPANGAPGSVEGLQPVCAATLKNDKGVETCDPFQLKGVHGTATPATFFGTAIEPDHDVENLLAPYLNEVKAMKDAKLGFNAKDALTRSFLGESALGNLIADVSREAMPGTDLGLANGGGLRANINPGPVTYGSVFGVMPFDNQAAVMSMPGDKLLDLVKVGLFGNVGTYSWSSNLALTADGCELKVVTIDGQPIDPKRVYKVSTSDFLAGGGSGVSKINLPKENVQIFWDHDKIVRELTVAVLKKWNRDLQATDFYRADAPRQKILKKCDAPHPGGN
jgi:5'-nucleotidase